jgi:hypothetical protein
MEIGKPRRIHRVEPVRSPVPKRAEPAEPPPQKPAKPLAPSR